MTTQLEKEIARLAGIGIDVTNHPTSPYAEPIIRQQNPNEQENN